MQRIIIIGCPGSGKTTLANLLGKKLGIAVEHLDRIMWLPNYEPIPYKKFLDAQEEIFKRESWIIDGNFTKSIPKRIEMADTIIFFDIPKYVCLWRLLKRYFLNYGNTRADMGGGNKDGLGFKFIKFVLTYPTNVVYQMLEVLPDHKRLYVIHNSRELEEFIKTIK